MTSSLDPVVTCLTVKLVEGLHLAAIRGFNDRVRSIVSNLQDASMPGLVEYQCLRRSTCDTLDLPALPEQVRRSVVGRALGEVDSPYGMRTSGRFFYNSNLQPSAAEFFHLRTVEDYVGHEYRLFETRWGKAGERIGLRSLSSLLQLALSAMCENGVLHAKCSDGILAGYRLKTDSVLFSVADTGRGVLGSLKTNPHYSNLIHHVDALREALKFGVSCTDTGGTGFYQVFKALTGQHGTIRFRTGNACITMDGRNFQEDLGNITYPETMQGFQVTVCCRRSNISD
jgi:hypothetical protein